MAYFNFTARSKFNRMTGVNGFSTDLGAAALFDIYTGTIPICPDITPTGSLLGSVPLNSTPGTYSLFCESAAINSGGTGTGSTSAAVVTLTTGTGTQAVFSNCTVTGGVLTALGAQSNAGSYSSLANMPTLNGCPVTVSGATVSGATLDLQMSSRWALNVSPQPTLASAPAGGVCTFGRFRNPTTGFIVADADIGTSGTSVIINSTTIVSGGPIVMQSFLLTEL